MIQYLVEAMELRIPTEEKFLVVCLSDRAGIDGVFTFQREQFSLDTSMSPERLDLAMGWLIERGFVERSVVFIDDVRYQQELQYRLLLPSVGPPRHPNLQTCPSKLREAVIVAFAEVCSYCQYRGNSTTGPDGASWSVDRIVPGIDGGLYVANNVTLACRSCNSAKGGRSNLFRPVRSLAAVLEQSEMAL